MFKKLSTALVASLMWMSIADAEEKVQIPKAIDKELVGEWKVVKMGQNGKMEVMPDGRSIGFIFNADGKGFQLKGERKIAIIWGASDQGKFAAQWNQPNGNGDAVAGKWAISAEGLQLDLTEYEDGKGPGEETFTMLCKRVE